MSGYNATVFAYGATGTGKTYTMLGTQQIQYGKDNGNSNQQQIPGLIELTIQDIFRQAASEAQNQYEVRVSYLEIYNENIKDLLVPKSRQLDLRDDPVRGPTIWGLTEFVVTDTAYLKNIGKLSLIDLAGSERGGQTQNSGERLREGTKINRSLLALANCINALGDKTKRGSFVPYRDSKLTRLLKDSLSGNCKTVMIVSISPASIQFEDTLNALKYATRAKAIENIVAPNQKVVEYQIVESYKIVQGLNEDMQLIPDENDEIPQIKEQQSIPRVNRIKSCQCVGQDSDMKEAEQIYDGVFELLEKKMQLQLSLAELEQQQFLNAMEIQQKTSQKDKQELDLLKRSTTRNQFKELNMQGELAENAKQTRALLDSIPKKVVFKHNRAYLDLQIKYKILELQNQELKRNVAIWKLQAEMLGNYKGQQRNIEPQTSNHIADGSTNSRINSQQSEGDYTTASKNYQEVKHVVDDIRRKLATETPAVITDDDDADGENEDDEALIQAQSQNRHDKNRKSNEQLPEIDVEDSKKIIPKPWVPYRQWRKYPNADNRDVTVKQREKTNQLERSTQMERQSGESKRQTDKSQKLLPNLDDLVLNGQPVPQTAKPGRKRLN